VIEDPLIAEATSVLYDGRSYEERKRASEAIALVHGIECAGPKSSSA
jgi:hypothetical protein